MQMRLTLRSRDDGPRDVELRAPHDAVVGDVSALLVQAYGLAGTDGEHPQLWLGSRALTASTRLHQCGMWSGCVIGIGHPAPRGRRGPNAAVRLHVVSGPDAGRIEPVPRGRLTIGRDPACEVRLTDPDVSRRHAELIVAPTGISVRDLGSSNGTTILSVREGLRPVADVGTELGLGSYLTVGESTLCVSGVTTPPAAIATGEDGALQVNRPPRLDTPPPARLDLPAEAADDRPSAVPWIAALLPALAGVGLAYYLHSPQFLAFALLSPLVLLATSMSERLGGRARRKRTRTSLRRRRLATAEAIAALAEAETTYRRQAHPDPSTLLGTATTPDARLWERRRSDPDFLDVRLGLGHLPARAVVRLGHETLPPRVLPGVPAVVSLRDGALGIVGPRPLALPLARWVIGQAAVLHSPGDLQIAALLSEGNDDDWRWLRWLPHVDTSTGQTRLARSVDDRHRLIAELSALIDERGGRYGEQGPGRHPWTLVLIDRSSALPEIGSLLAGAQRASAAGVSFLCLDNEERRLPPGCRVTAALTGETGSRVRIHTRVDGRDGASLLVPASASVPAPAMAPAHPAPHGRSWSPGPDTGARPRTEVPVADRVDEAWCDEVARCLAPLSDPAADRRNELPSAVRARDLFALPDLEPQTVRDRWACASGRASTPVGMGADGLFELDLGRDGPHALIAGTTGAGKSELLQTLVAGLAVHASPTDLQFVLIDYKGGAAFGECARLPHTVGLVTDLDGHLTARALRSLDAELRRRETLFARLSVADLDAYRRAAPAEVLGRLVLVVDEFASLAEELPDFVTGLVGIAQRGRSLGVHLILATQRPGGVVSPEIRANTALRIALRVTDPGESNDVVGSDLAAQIDQHLPGRAIVRTGQSLHTVQLGRISGPVAETATPIEVRPVDPWGVALAGPDQKSARVTDLAVIVTALLRAAADLARPRRPWLDALPSSVDLTTLPTTTTTTTPSPGRARMPAEWAGPSEGPEEVSRGREERERVVIGLSDRPGEQAQPPFILDLGHASTMLFAGGPRSGRTTVLRAAAVGAAGHLSVDEAHVYAIDCAGGGLRSLADLPHCGAVVGPDAVSAVAALVNRLAQEIDCRRLRLTDTGFTTATRPARSAEADPALLLLLDGWEGFLAAVEDHDAGRTVDALLHLVRDGVGAGLTVMITGDRATLAARLSSAVQRRFVLRLSDPTDFALAGLSRQQVPDTMPPGRAVDTADGTEVQFAQFAAGLPPQEQAAALRLWIDAVREREHRRPSRRLPFAVRALPRQVQLSEIVPAETSGRLVLGVGGDAADPICVNVGSSDGGTGDGVHFLVAGPPRSGRSTFLQIVLVQAARTSGLAVVVAGPRSAVSAAARELRVTVVEPDGGGAELTDIETSLDRGVPVMLIIDDTEQLNDTVLGDRLSALIHRCPRGLSVFASGRADDLALAFRGVAAELKRSRVGLLLQPGPGDGELFGVRLPFLRSVSPPGRGLLIAPGLIPDRADQAPLPLQVALP